jgi:hypothetical protein
MNCPGASAINCNLVPGDIGARARRLELALMFSALLEPLTLITIFNKFSDIFFQRRPSEVGPQGVGHSNHSRMSQAVVVKLYQRLAKGLRDHHLLIAIDLEGHGTNPNRSALLIYFPRDFGLLSVCDYSVIDWALLIQ